MDRREPEDDDLPVTADVLVAAARWGIPFCRAEPGPRGGATRMLRDARGPAPAPKRRLPILPSLHGVRLDATPDKYALTDLPSIDCASRLHLCQARCCALTFALSAQDIGEGIVAWDRARPYYNARREDGYCVHHDGRGCTIYAQRPAICRTYDCRDDERIWADFDGRIPSERR